MVKKINKKKNIEGVVANSENPQETSLSQYDIEKWSGCATFTQEEIDNDPRLKAILSK